MSQLGIDFEPFTKWYVSKLDVLIVSDFFILISRCVQRVQSKFEIGKAEANAVSGRSRMVSDTCRRRRAMLRSAA